MTMRELKFRVWIKSTNTMQNNVGFHPHLSMDLAAEDKYYETNEDGRWLYSPSENLVFMQYTGIKTAKEVELYEGDTVSVYQESNGSKLLEMTCKIVYYKDRFCMETEIDGKTIELGIQEMLDKGRSIEVIGNCYEPGQKNEAKPLL